VRAEAHTDAGVRGVAALPRVGARGCCAHQLVPVVAELVEEAHLEEEDIVSREAVHAARRGGGRHPSLALAERLASRPRRVEGGGGGGEAYGGRTLPRQHPFRGARLPLEVTADVVRHAVPVQAQDVHVRRDASRRVCPILCIARRARPVCHAQ
jgi:hypothetical protein